MVTYLWTGGLFIGGRVLSTVCMSTAVQLADAGKVNNTGEQAQQREKRDIGGYKGKSQQ